MSTQNTTRYSGQPMLGRYALMREIARSNDIVWEARDTQMNRRVAVKELALTSSVMGQARRERIDRFYREARAAGNMTHPNIVTIYEVSEDSGRYFIAMEYLEGETLRTHLQNVGTLPVSEVVRIGVALCEALEYAHRAGVIHRDIKPDNVHLLPGGQVKLTDFGIARIQHEDSMTVAGQIFGTPSYMSPEQIVGKEIDARSDLFSLGVMLFECVTGYKPFTGDSVVTITYNVMNSPTPPAPGAPPSLETVLQRALAKKPEHRFPNASAMREALLAVLPQTGWGLNNAYPHAIPYTHQNPTVGASNIGQVPPTMLGAAPQRAAQIPTAQYGMQTRQAFAPAYPPSVMPSAAPPVMPLATSAVSDESHENRGRFWTMLVVSLLIIGVVTGIVIAGKKAFDNSTIQLSYGKDSENYAHAATLYQSGNYAQAALLFETLRKHSSNSSIVQKSTQGEVYCYRKLGQAAQAQNDLETAEKMFKSALAVSPDDAPAKEELAAVQKIRESSAPALPAAPDTTPQTTSEFPRRAAPGTPNLDASDFTSQNAANAAKAEQLLRQAEAATQRGDANSARDLLSQAAAAAPGSPASTEAQQRIGKLLEQNNPTGGG